MSLGRRFLPWIPIAVAAVVLAWHAQQYAFVTDDAYISFVYSRNFAEHGQLVFNLGDPVEGYTNFLWTFLLGISMMLGANPETSALTLGLLCGIGTLIVTFRLMRRVLPEGSPWAYVPSLLLACSSGFACWTSGGLETQLFTLLVVGAIDQYVAATSAVDGGVRQMRRMGALLALAAMTRPEGLLLVALIGLHRLALNIIFERRLIPRRAEWWALVGFVGIWAPWFVWRSWYYGYLLPNTYYVKAHGPWQPKSLGKQMWGHGFFYLNVWLKQTALTFAALPVLVGVLAIRPRTQRFVLVTFLVLLAVVYGGYAASVGGDFMGLHRFIMPLFVVAAVLVALGCQWLAEYAPRWVSASLALALVAAFAVSQARLTRSSLREFPDHAAQAHGIDTPRYLIDYTEDRAAIGRAMAGCFVPSDFSIVGGAGAQPYFGRMTAIDVFGLVSEKIAHNSPRTRARAGHTKFASDTVIASYDPTFVFSCYVLTPTPTVKSLPCNESFWRARGYERVTMEINGLRERVNRNLAVGKPAGEPDRYYTFFAKTSRAFSCPGVVQ